MNCSVATVIDYSNASPFSQEVTWELNEKSSNGSNNNNQNNKRQQEKIENHQKNFT